MCPPSSSAAQRGAGTLLCCRPPTEGLISTGSPRISLAHSTECILTVGLSATRVSMGARRSRVMSAKLMAAAASGGAGSQAATSPGLEQPAPDTHLPLLSDAVLVENGANGRAVGGCLAVNQAKQMSSPPTPLAVPGGGYLSDEDVYLKRSGRTEGGTGTGRAGKCQAHDAPAEQGFVIFCGTLQAAFRRTLSGLEPYFLLAEPPRVL
jgi:hypothetical protein